MNRVDRDELLARVSDVLRRSGVEDAESLVVRLEAAIPVWKALPEAFMFGFVLTLPAGSYPGEFAIPLLSPEACVSITTRGLWPFSWRCREAFLRLPIIHYGRFMFRERRNGLETARHSVTLFADGPVTFDRNYDADMSYDLELVTLSAFVLHEPMQLTLSLSGTPRR